MKFEGKKFDLLSDRDFFVILFLPIKKTEHGVFECADRRVMAGGEIVLFCKSREFFNHLIAFIEYEDEGPAEPARAANRQPHKG